jgi:hypothetical protein
VHETEEKLTKLREGYRAVCEVVEEKLGIPARILDGRGGIEEVADAAMRELDAIGIAGSRKSEDGSPGGEADG